MLITVYIYLEEGREESIKEDDNEMPNIQEDIADDGIYNI